MTAAARRILVSRGLTCSEIAFLDHLMQCRGVWKLQDNLTTDANGDGPLALLMGKLGCAALADIDAVMRRLVGE